MKILITGSNGYIARSIINSFNDKYEIIGLSRYDADLTVSNDVDNFFKKHKVFDVIIHTAITGGSRLVVENSDVIDKNLKMYYNLLNHREKYNKFISLGSGAELYHTNTPYGLSKKVIHESILDKQNFYNIRIFGLFDENELPTRFIKSNIIRYIKKESIEIYESKKMDFFYMEDLISLIDLYLKNDNLLKEVNCSYIEKYSLLNIADIINNLNDYKVPIIYNKSRGKDYIGEFNLPISYLGLEYGIKSSYNKLNKT